MNITLVDDPTSVRRTLELPWGTITNNGTVIYLICPMCAAIIPANFSDTHTTTNTPKNSHASSHIAIADALNSRKET